MTDNDQTTDLLVIGGGPGGYTAAFRAADLGLDVTLVTDDEDLGGVCLLRGCIPSKILLHVVDTMASARHLADLGVRYNTPDPEIDVLRSWTNDAVSRLAAGLSQLARKRKVNVIHGRAILAGSTEARIVSDGETTVSFERAIVATGSHPISISDVEFDDRVMDSATALQLRAIPQRLLVVGGGYVGLELGSVYAALGSRVTVTEATDRLMPGVDADLVKPLHDRLEKTIHSVQLNTPVRRLERTSDAVDVRFGGAADGETGTFDSVLVAVGRHPNTSDVGLEKTGAQLDDAGFIAVNLQRKTHDDHIYAVGDVTGGTRLAHEAMREGKVAAEAIVGQNAAFDPSAIPAVVYTNPQIAWCGLTEGEAATHNQQVDVTRFPWSASGRAVTTGSADGLTKIVSDPDSGRVLGVGISGRQAETLIAEGVLAIEMGAVLEDLALTVHAHPTLSETIAESAELAAGKAIHAP